VSSGSGLPFSPAPLVSPCVKRRSRRSSAPGALILAEAELNATAGKPRNASSRVSGFALDRRPDSFS
jgi:hypothetical protein